MKHITQLISFALLMGMGNAVFAEAEAIKHEILTMNCKVVDDETYYFDSNDGKYYSDVERFFPQASYYLSVIKFLPQEGIEESTLVRLYWKSSYSEFNSHLLFKSNETANEFKRSIEDGGYYFAATLGECDSMVFVHKDGQRKVFVKLPEASPGFPYKEL